MNRWAAVAFAGALLAIVASVLVIPTDRFSRPDPDNLPGFAYQQALAARQYPSADHPVRQEFARARELHLEVEGFRWPTYRWAWKLTPHKSRGMVHKERIRWDALVLEWALIGLCVAGALALLGWKAGRMSLGPIAVAFSAALLLGATCLWLPRQPVPAKWVFSEPVPRPDSGAAPHGPVRWEWRWNRRWYTAVGSSDWARGTYRQTRWHWVLVEQALILLLGGGLLTWTARRHRRQGAAES